MHVMTVFVCIPYIIVVIDNIVSIILQRVLYVYILQYILLFNYTRLHYFNKKYIFL